MVCYCGTLQSSEGFLHNYPEAIKLGNGQFQVCRLKNGRFCMATWFFLPQGNCCLILFMGLMPHPDSFALLSRSQEEHGQPLAKTGNQSHDIPSSLSGNGCWATSMGRGTPVSIWRMSKHCEG